MNNSLIKKHQFLSTDDKTRSPSTWLQDYKITHQEAWHQIGLPKKNNEGWKYTDLTQLANKKFSPDQKLQKRISPTNEVAIKEIIHTHRLHHQTAIQIVTVDGCFSPTLSTLNPISSESIISSLQDAIQHNEKLVKQYWPEHFHIDEAPFACINSALFNDGIFMYVAEHCQTMPPIHLLSIITDEYSEAIHPRNIIVLAKASNIKIYEEFYSLNSNVNNTLIINSVTAITLEENAKLTYAKIQSNNIANIYFNYTLVDQYENSQLIWTDFLLGAKFAREDITINLNAPYATCETNGFYRTSEKNQYQDHHITANHYAPHTQSSMLYKGILNHDARAVFNGRVYVHPSAQKIHAYQANHNLVMSTNAEVYSKPELEIYANDVKCKHGSTIGQFDPLAIFYLRSRGISLTDAKQILLQGFAQQVIEKVDNNLLQTRLNKMV